MLFNSSPMLAQLETQYTAPNYFKTVFLGLLALGAIGWLVAAALGFARSRAFGPAARWFALAAVSLVIYHLQFVIMTLAAATNPDMLLSIGAFLNLFIVIGAACAIVGFARLTNQR